jgi:hypothetical protein
VIAQVEAIYAGLGLAGSTDAQAPTPVRRMREAA